MLWPFMFTNLPDYILHCHVCLSLLALLLVSSSDIPSKCASTGVQQCNIVGLITRDECVQHLTPKTPWSEDHDSRLGEKIKSPNGCGVHISKPVFLHPFEGI